MNYQNIAITKDMYKNGERLTSQLERLDPSTGYSGELAGLDAFERQLKRFDIKVSGERSDLLQKFFSTGESASLFPEYVARAVGAGMEQSDHLGSVIAAKTMINSLDYRTITTDFSEDDKELKVVLEGGMIPQVQIRLKDNLVRLYKRGRMLAASYEAIKFQHIDLFSVALKQIGAYIAKSQFADAVRVLIDGDGNDNAADRIETAESGKLAYGDLVGLWGEFEDYEMNVLLASPDMMLKVLALPEMQDAAAGLNFQGTGKLATPLGASLIRSSAVPAGTIVALDSRCALEMVCAGEVSVDSDRLIDCQLERTAITATAGFAKIFPQAVKVLGLKA